MAFFVKEGDSYRQVSQMKQVSVYSYIYTPRKSIFLRKIYGNTRISMV